MPIKLLSFEYKSALSPHIICLVSEKRELGYIYNNEAKIFKHLDLYWTDHQYPDDVFSRERIDEWCRKTDTEGNKSLSNRIVATRQLAIYMRSIGLPAFIPEHNILVEKPFIHIFSSQEVKELFHQIDSYHPEINDPKTVRLSKAYRVLFRLILCLGLRRTESCEIKLSEYDSSEGVLKITEAKNAKHRFVYLNDDLTAMLNRHIEETILDVGYKPQWMFPGYDPSKPIAGGSLSSRFNDAWNKTSFAGKVDKKPTVHSLRHTFVMLRIRQWEAEGKDVNEMLPYLSKHLGHLSLDDTYYYYQRIQESLEHIRKKDTITDAVIPEVLPR